MLGNYLKKVYIMLYPSFSVGTYGIKMSSGIFFWEDVRKVAEDYFEMLTGTDEAHKEQIKTKPHFLGAIIIQQQLTTLKVPDLRHVIDGQQRLTTLQLLLDAIQLVCEKSDHPVFADQAKFLAEFVTNKKNLYNGEYVFKLWPSKFDQEIFEHVMDNDLDANKHKGTLISQAHEFFQQQVKEWLNVPKEQLEHRIEALAETVTTKLQIAVIELDEQADPHIIFETLNARGTPLAQFELIKNFSMSKIKTLTNDIWGDLDDEWWKEEIRQGRLFRPRLDMLFNYWLEAHTGREVKPEKVFKEFTKYVKKCDILQVMSEIRKDFTNYRQYKEQEGRNKVEKSFYYHIDVMKADVITPILLLLLSGTTDVNKRALDVLESFLVRRMICRYGARSYSDLVMKLIKRLRDGDIRDADTIIIEYLKEEKARATEWPDDQILKDKLKELELADLLTQGRLRLILEGIEQQMRDPKKTDEQETPKKLTIEHIMPCGWRERDWPLTDGIDKEERDKLINTIGNLTLVTRPLNSSMSNAGWEHKRKGLQEYSLLMLNKNWSLKQSWSETDIQHRSLEIAEIVSKRWPGPNSQKWDT